jgi:hypothetical protein
MHVQCKVETMGFSTSPASGGTGSVSGDAMLTSETAAITAGYRKFVSRSGGDFTAAQNQGS